ncbi:zinc metalloproteinase/disintegrin-like [Asterias amurensis]|uniref:zinc metalloproteinase/disintegrin-like n=1 Tax=Asterias amurensis TaxID=7602 RepID=UPI003AB877C1
MVRIFEEGEVKIPLRTDRMYSGTVTSDPESIVSAETSHGLTAIIFYEKGTMVVQPLSGKSALEMATLGLGHPHVVYKGSDDDVMCGTEDEDVDDIDEGDFGFESYSCDGQSTKYLELAMFYDFQAWQQAGDTFHSEYLALFNLVKNVFQKPSLVGTNLVPKLVHAAYFADETVFKSNESIGLTLRAARAYCGIANPPESDPTHWDNAAFVSGYPVKGKTGLANVGSCGKKGSASVTKRRSLTSTAGTMCHEIGHNLSMKHDKPAICGPGKYIMSPWASKYKVYWDWSSCSRDYYCDFVGRNTCYDDA